MKKNSILLLVAVLFAMMLSCKQNDSKTQQGSMFPRGGDQAEHLDRFESEIQAFERADVASMPDKKGILFVGSSSIRLWSSLKDDFKPLPVINRGFGGSTIAEVNYYAERIVFKYEPAMVVFYCGENDLVEGRPPALVFQDFKKFIGETEKNLGAINFVYISAKPSPSRWDHWRKYETLNRMVEQFAQSRANLHFIDISRTLMDNNGNPDPSFFVEDQLHMNSTGYSNWTKIVRPVVDSLYETNVTVQ